ncbi:hypothetical protein CHUAL_005807 [Chamberlinius hualienensis]
MDSLVANYGSSSDDEEEELSAEDNTCHSKPTKSDGELFRAGLFGCIDDHDSDGPNDNDEEDKLPSTKQLSSAKLPKPSFNSTVDDLSGVENGVSVFANPFRAAEEAQKSLLEKHVKMTADSKQSPTINGKQVCWNYRKGRCRFGHNCKFAHDSDLPSGAIKKPETERNLKTNLLETNHTIVKQAQRFVSPPSYVSSQEIPMSRGDAPINFRDPPVENEEDDDGGPVSLKKKRKCGLGDNLIPSKKVMRMQRKLAKDWPV